MDNPALENKIKEIIVSQISDLKNEMLAAMNNMLANNTAAPQTDSLNAPAGAQQVIQNAQNAPSDGQNAPQTNTISSGNPQNRVPTPLNPSLTPNRNEPFLDEGAPRENEFDRESFVSRSRWEVNEPYYNRPYGQFDEEPFDGRNYAPSNIGSYTAQNLSGLPKFFEKEKPPVFDPKIFSPPQFLEKLEEYFEKQNVTGEHSQFLCAKYAMQDNKRVWVEFNNSRMRTYTDFKDIFLKSFWSGADKVAYKESIFKEKFRSVDENESLCDFFQRQFTRAIQHFPEMHFLEMKLHFRNQLPQEISLSLAQPYINNIDAMHDVLKEIDYVNFNFSQKAPESASASNEYKQKATFSQNYRGNNRYQPYSNNYTRGGRTSSHNAAEVKVNMIQDAPPQRPHTGASRGRNYDYRSSGGYQRPAPYYRGNARSRYNNPQNQRRDNGFNSNSNPNRHRTSSTKDDVMRQEMVKIVDEKLKSFIEQQKKPTDAKAGGKQNNSAAAASSTPRAAEN
jgi:hypothetical protein